MDLSMNLPLDEGFLRRQCPNCEREFKWHHGPTEGRPDDYADPDVYWCPYCGETAPGDHWWTEVQLEHAQETLAGPAMRMVADELGDAFKGTSGGSISFSVSTDDDEPEPPAALHEPTDMMIVEPPCHPWEPIKIDESWTSPIHCLLCGAPFAVH